MSRSSCTVPMNSSPPNTPTRASRLVGAAVAALLVVVIVAVLVFARRAPPPPAHAPVTPLLRPPLTPLFDDLERRTFNYFWDTANPDNGLIPDRYPYTEPFASIAAVGFGLTAYGIGAER